VQGRDGGTDLRGVAGTIDKLAGQVRKSGVDPELLKRLHWDEPDLHNFIAKYKQRLQALRAAEKSGSPKLDPTKGPGADRERAIHILRRAGLAKGVRSLDGQPPGANEKDQIRELFEGKKQSVSVEYRDLVEAYYRSLVGSR